MEQDTDPVGHYTYQIRPFEVDFTGNAFLTVLCNCLLNSAGLHARERRFGIDDLLAQHKAWVLSRFSVVMQKYPRRDDVIITQVATYEKKCYRIAGNSSFEVTTLQNTYFYA